MSIENAAGTNQLKPAAQVKIIQTAIARLHHVEVKDIISHSRQADLVRPRHLAIHFCVLALSNIMDFEKIGECFERDRTLVNHADEKVRGKVLADAKTLKLYQDCRAAVEKELGRALPRIELNPDGKSKLGLLINCLGFPSGPEDLAGYEAAIKMMGSEEVSTALSRVSTFEKTMLPFLKRKLHEALFP
jgi:hypothetical protein